MFPIPLLPQPWIPHNCQMTMPTNIVPSIQEELDQKPALLSLQLSFELSTSIGKHLTCWTMQMIGSRHGYSGNLSTLGGGRSLKLSMETQWATTAMPRPYNLPSSRLWLFNCLFPRKSNQNSERPHMVLVDCAFRTSYPMLIPLPRDFQVTRQEETLAPTLAL